jgi:hypothetical protein
MAGMAGGIVWGAVWGSLLGGLVLVLAALLLELGTGRENAAPEARVTPGARAPLPAPDAGPVLLRGVALGPPDAVAPVLAMRDPGPRTLLPRPAQPVVPHVTAGRPVPMPVADLPPPPASPDASIAAPLRAGGFGLPPGTGAGARVAGVRIPRPDPAARATRAAPTLTSPVPSAAAPNGPRPPSPLISAPARPTVAPPPVAGETVAASLLPDTAAARGAPPAPASAVADAARPQPPGPRVAFVLDGTATAPRPAWIGGQVADTAQGRLTLATGGGIVTDPAAAFAGDLIAYARLDGPDAADATALARIGLRARRDGVVLVLVAPDPALWARVGAWLDGPARDLVPVAAESLRD